uniref:Uncharacterized protein n=1 Tax=Serratia marcescens TaxID=615 RepID=A0A345IQG1_SERMA|nr:hypothetical protein [Serratia marcescens]AXH02757.1 hypothetical protein [Serratia marcescens]
MGYCKRVHSPLCRLHCHSHAIRWFSCKVFWQRLHTLSHYFSELL